MGAFGSMLESGAGWGSAMIAALQGHQMTEEQAAICLQSHARRKSAENELTARKGEMAHMENEYREYQRYQMAAALRADIEREHWAASQINAGWRGHLDRQHVAKMRKEKKPVRRSFSWSSKKKNAKAAAPSAASQAPSAASSAALDELDERVRPVEWRLWEARPPLAQLWQEVVEQQRQQRQQGQAAEHLRDASNLCLGARAARSGLGARRGQHGRDNQGGRTG